MQEELARLLRRKQLVVFTIMAFGVFMHRFDSIYDDSPSEHYQFPGQYLSRARQFEGGWVLFLEPTKVADSRGYFAVARVERIIADPAAEGMHRAIIEAGSYLDFANPVPFSDAGSPIERGLLNEAGRLSGRAQSAVRPIAEADFTAIIGRGLADNETFLPRADPAPGTTHEIDDLSQSTFVWDGPVRRDSILVSRIQRDRIFRRRVLAVYGERCALTGLRLINGGGRAEVEAAHIMPVAKGGPDSVQNGLALCGTAHWMFDRGLLTLSDDLSIRVSRQLNDPASIEALLNRDGLARAPVRPTERPHPHFLAWHRDNCFKQ